MKASLTSKTTKYAGYLWVLLLYVGCVTSVVAQPIPLYTWRTHFTHHNAEVVFLSPDRTFAGTSNSLFYLQDNELVPWAKGSQLSDAHVTAGAYQAPGQRLLIGYENGNLDWITPTQQVNFTAIKDASRTGDKAIHNIHAQGDTVYLFTGVGCILLQPRTGRVLESWLQLGRDAEPVAVYNGVLTRDHIYLATSKGVIRNSRDFFINRQDWSTWERYQLPSVSPTAPITYLARAGDRIVASTGSANVFEFNGQKWIRTRTLPANIQSLRSGIDKNLLVATQDTLYVQDSLDNWQAYGSDQWSNLADARQSEDGTFWLADREEGLVWGDGNTWQSAFPQGPATDQVAELAGIRGRMAAVPGGFVGGAAQQQPGQLMYWNGAEWENYQDPELPTDWASIASDPNGDSLYIGAFGHGLVAYNRAAEEASRYTTQDFPFNDGGIATITDVAYDAQGRLYVIRPLNTPSLFRRSADGWEAFTINHPRAPFIEKVQPSVFGYVFLSIASFAGGGMLVFDPETGDVRALSTDNGIPGSIIYDMAEDQNGFIWMAGNDGTSAFTQVSAAFSAIFIAERPRINFQEAFLNTPVYSLAVDGGNRLWFGTNNGAWRLDGLGTEEALNFTSENSPLPSDIINAIGHTPQTGEVFFATPNGMVSYMDDAPEATANHAASVRVFPNPVEPTYLGVVAVRGLPNRGYLRVTDLAGRRIQNLRTNGNTATWDLMDLAGNRVPAGVYLLVSSSEDGDESEVGRVVVKE